MSSTCTREPPTVTTGKTPPTGPLTRGERRAALIAATVLLAAIALGATVWAVFASGSDSGVEKCMTVSTASSMGGGVEHACGDAAHAWCQAAYAEHDAHAQAVQRQCREAGIV